MAPILGLESSSDPAEDLSHALLFSAIAVGMLSFLCAFLFSAYKLGSFCISTSRSTRQPPPPELEQPVFPMMTAGLKPLTILSWATLIDDTVGAHPHALPLDQRVCPPGYLSYIHLPAAFPSLPSTTRVGLVATQCQPSSASSDCSTIEGPLSAR
jgi:hypothetical protein